MILDELSYLSFNRNQAELLFHVLSGRNERGSVIITTNLEFSRWTEIFPDTMLTAALADRLSYMIEMIEVNSPMLLSLMLPLCQGNLYVGASWLPPVLKAFILQLKYRGAYPECGK
ncbi:MAG: ATP-binding protein [Syntrophomonadaceae bacterium]